MNGHQADKIIESINVGDKVEMIKQGKTYKGVVKIKEKGIVGSVARFEAIGTFGTEGITGYALETKLITSLTVNGKKIA